MKRLLDLAPDGVYRRLLAAFCFTGMRTGEVTALRVRDFDRVRGVIDVSRSLSPGIHGELIEQTPKRHKARAVQLTRALRPYADAAARGTAPDDLLFAGPEGGRLTNHNLRRAVDCEMLRATLLRLHDLRHTFATILFDAGATAPDVQAVLGHSSLQVTERYSRVREGVASRAGEVVDRALGPPKQPSRAPGNGTK